MKKSRSGRQILPDHESETTIAKITTNSLTFIYKIFTKSHYKDFHSKPKG
ncbi:hypothetical protein HYC85_029804 [Camellia sinensis]|uniref:Uncharacterized protein n=1 Tax=Camellia sinensis TaxID=4442 RepID=A0A7J7FYW7_CAMSI|nr:hypothetical protein HYC85_029804 [Camellia sinensis]